MSKHAHPAHPGEVLREYLPRRIDRRGREAPRRYPAGSFRAAERRAGVSASMALRLEGALEPAPRCGSTCRRATTSGTRANAHRESSGCPHRIGRPDGVQSQRRAPDRSATQERGDVGRPTNQFPADRPPYPTEPARNRNPETRARFPAGQPASARLCPIVQMGVDPRAYADCNGSVDLTTTSQQIVRSSCGGMR